MSAKQSQSQCAVLGALVGIAVGLALPPLVRRLKNHYNNEGESSSSDDNESHHAPADASTGNAVRSGLDGSTGSGAVRLPPTTLQEYVAKILTKAGASPSHARLVASVLAYADARGIPSHGANRADTYVNELTAGLVDGRAVPAITKQSGCTAVVDGKNGLGAVTSNLAMETAIQLAQKHGVGIVVCHNSNHYGAAGYWANMALQANLVGMSFTNTSPFAVPTGGRDRAVGTNPFCFFAPAAPAAKPAAAASGDDNAHNKRTSDSFQLDMATTVVPVGKIEVMDRLNKPVPAGWGVDRHGANCDNAEEICKNGGLYPLGGAEETAGYKGYGLGMFVEIMCSMFSGADVGPNVQPWLATRQRPINYGHCFVVIDPGRFAPGFAERLGDYLHTMRSLPGNVRVAGDPERAYEDDAESNGILLHGPVAATLKSLAVRLGVEGGPEELRDLDASISKESLYAK